MRELSSRSFFLFLMTLFSLTLLSGCEFSFILHKDIFLAQKYLDERKFASAAAVFEDLLKKSIEKDTRVKVLYQLGDIYYLYLNRPRMAVKKYEEILNSGEVFWQIQALERMAEIEFQYLRNYSDAIKHYQTLSEFNPKLKNYDFYQLQIANSMVEISQEEKATKLYEQLANDKDSSYKGEALYYLGRLYFRSAKWKKSLTTWQDYLKCDQQTKERTTEVKFYMANTHEMLNQLTEAYSLYYSLLDSYPNIELVKTRLKSVYARRVARKR